MRNEALCEHWLPPPFGYPAPPLLTIGEAAALLRVSEHGVRRYANAGELRPTRMGRRNHFRLQECLRFIQRREGER